MKRVLLALAFVACASQAWAQTFALVDGASTAPGGSGTTLSVTLTGVSVGDVIAVCVGAYSDTTDVSTVKLNTTAETLTGFGGAVGDSNDEFWVFWTTASTQSGSVTVDAVYAASASNRVMAAMAFSHAGTATADAGSATGSLESTITSGDFTAIGTDIVVSACGLGTVAISNQRINAVASTTGAEQPTSNFSMWYQTFTSGFTNDADADLALFSLGAASAVSFSATAGAAPGGVPFGTLSTLGVGR